MASFFLLTLLAFTTMLTTNVVAQKVLEVNITILYGATAEGAVCLDGTPPAYYLDRGYGSGLRSWIIAIDGGGWCDSTSHCRGVSNTSTGTSRKMEAQVKFSGILDNHAQTNPDFYNWNRVRVRYCDSSSFTGDVEDVSPDTKLYYRGARIFKAIMNDLLGKGMQEAENAILSGTSAGGLATILNCDKFKSLLPNEAKVKCLADAAFFINGRTIAGHSDIADLYDRVVTLHGSAKNLPPSCTSVMERPSLCFFPQNVIPHVQTPLFIINSAYDSWQVKETLKILFGFKEFYSFFLSFFKIRYIKNFASDDSTLTLQIRNVLVPNYLDPQHDWDDCKKSISNCTYSQLVIIKGFGVEFLKTFEGLGPSYTRGYFITSCHSHGQIQLRSYWFSATAPRLLRKTIAEAVADWFFERAWIHQFIDPYPCARDCKLIIN